MSGAFITPEGARISALGGRALELETELREARLMLAAIVTQHGESLGDGRHRLAVDPEHLETAEARHLSVQFDPASGAAIVRVRPL